MTTYLAIDPGLTTGIAHYDTRSEEFGSLEIRGRYELYSYLRTDWKLSFPYRGGCPDVLIIERWDVRKDTFGKSAQEDARYIIGAVDYLADVFAIDYREQRPGEAKKFATNDKLRTLGWYTGGEGHGDDAARHLLVALAKDRNPYVIEALT